METRSRLMTSRSLRLHESAIQEMIELVHASGALSFTAGEPSADLVPARELREALSSAFDGASDLLGYYHDSAGHVKLRDWIIRWMKHDGLLPKDMGLGNILLTTGSQEGISLVSEALVERGDVVAVENPSYPEAFLAFEREGATIKGVPFDNEGPSTEGLEQVAAKARIKFFYTIPCFQNPTGFVTSAKRRKEILEVAKKHDFLILEDDPYRHLWFDEHPPASYMSLPENDGRVIYLGSFSKVIAPGMRCGWVVSPDWISPSLHRLRVASTLNLPAILHQGILEFLQNGNFPGHLENLRQAYSTRRDGLVAALRRHFENTEFRFDVPRGGFFLWGIMSDLEDSDAFARFAVRKEGIGVIAGKIFSPDPREFTPGTLRLSYAKVSPEEAEEGCRRLERALCTYRNIA